VVFKAEFHLKPRSSCFKSDTYDSIVFECSY